MKSKMLRIFLGAALLVLAAALLRQWRSTSSSITASRETATMTAASQEPSAPLRFPPLQSTRRAPVVAPVQPAPRTPQKLFVE